MSATATIIVAVLGAISTVTVGYFTLRGTVKATAAKQQADENASALAAWRELVQPLRDENARLVKQLEAERVEHAAELAAEKVEHAAELAAEKLEHTAVLAALQPLNDEIEERRRKR